MKKQILSLLLLLGTASLVTSCSCKAQRVDIGPATQPETEKQLVSIETTSLPTKLQYNVGESFCSAGLIVQANYDDNSHENVSGYTLSIVDGHVFTTDEVEDNKQVIITYKTKTTSFTIDVKENQVVKTLQSIRITHEADKKDYYINDTIDIAGLEITAYYNIGDPVVVTSLVTVSSPNMTTSGRKAVTISYSEGNVTKTTSYSINVTPKLLSLELGLFGVKTSYEKNEDLSFDNLTVYACYNNNDRNLLSSDKYSIDSAAFQKGVVGTYEIAISYSENEITVSASYSVDVVEERLMSVSIKNNPTKTQYYVNETFNPSGLVLTLSYSDGTSKDISTGYSLDLETGYQFKNSDIGTKKVTAYYQGFSAQFNLTIVADEVISLSLIGEYKTSFNQGDEFSFGGQVIALMASSNTQDVTDDVTFSGYDMSTPGNQTVLVAYNETISTSYDIVVNEVVEPVTDVSIRVEGQMVSFEVGDTFLFDGEVYVLNSKNEEYQTSNYIIDSSLVNMNEAGEYQVTIEYNGTSLLSVSYTIYVTNPTYRYVLDFVNLFNSQQIQIIPDQNVTNSGRMIAIRPDNNQEIEFVYYNCDLSHGFTIKEGGFVSMLYKADDSNALNRIHSVTFGSDDQYEYELYTGFAGEIENDEVPFVARYGYSYITSYAPKLLGDKPSYISIVAPNDDIEIRELKIVYLGGAHSSNPFLNGSRYNAIVGQTNYDLDSIGYLPHANDDAYWAVPDFQGNTPKANYRARIGTTISTQTYTGYESLNVEPKYNEYDLHFEFNLPQTLYHLVNVTGSAISYPENSFLANDTSRQPVISDPLLIKEKEINKETTRYIINVDVKKALTRNAGGPFFSVDWEVDLSSLYPSAITQLMWMRYFVSTSYVESDYERPQLVGDNIAIGSEKAYRLYHNIQATEETWEIDKYVAGNSNPYLTYKGKQITSLPSLGEMVKGQKYKISYVEGSQYYTFA